MYAIPNKTIILNSVCVVAGPPVKVGGLELMYHSEQELRLQWSRPGDFPSDILITYHINITNTSSGAVTQVGHDVWCVHVPSRLRVVYIQDQFVYVAGHIYSLTFHSAC